MNPSQRKAIFAKLLKQKRINSGSAPHKGTALIANQYPYNKDLYYVIMMDSNLAFTQKIDDIIKHNTTDSGKIAPLRKTESELKTEKMLANAKKFSDEQKLKSKK